MELADMQDLGSCAQALGFKSPYPHQLPRADILPGGLFIAGFFAEHGSNTQLWCIVIFNAW